MSITNEDLVKAGFCYCATWVDALKVPIIRYSSNNNVSFIFVDMRAIIRCTMGKSAQYGGGGSWGLYIRVIKSYLTGIKPLYMMKDGMLKYDDEKYWKEVLHNDVNNVSRAVEGRGKWWYNALIVERWIYRRACKFKKRAILVGTHPNYDATVGVFMNRLQNMLYVAREIYLTYYFDGGVFEMPNSEMEAKTLIEHYIRRVSGSPSDQLHSIPKSISNDNDVKTTINSKTVSLCIYIQSMQHNIFEYRGN